MSTEYGTTKYGTEVQRGMINTRINGRNDGKLFLEVHNNVAFEELLNSDLK